MSNVIFEDSNSNSSARVPNRGFIMSFLIKRGIVKSDSSANMLMVIVSIIFLVVAVYVVYLTFYQQGPVSTNQIPPIQQKIQGYIKQGMNPVEARRKALNDIRTSAGANTNTNTVVPSTPTN